MGRLGLSPGALVLCAYSGGADSCALLSALSASAASGGYRLRALYVDHGIRPEAELAAERELAASVCAALGIPLYTVRIRRGAVARLAGLRGIGIEAAAREFRYHAFERAVRRFDARAIATAHHADDQAETILMRLLSGAGPAGLAGMPERRPLGGTAILVRPALSLRRQALDAYRIARGLPCSRDSTNDSAAHRRNALRAELVPALTRIFPGWVASVRASAGKSRLASETVDALAARLVRAEDPRDTDGIEILDADRFRTAESAVRRRALERAVARASTKDQRRARKVPSLRMLAALEDDACRLLDAGTGGKSGIAGRGWVRIRRIADRLEISALLDFPLPSGYFFTIDAPGSFESGSLRLTAYWVIRESGDNSDPEGIPEDGFSFPLVVRSRRPGDRIVTSAGDRRVDDLLAGWKLPRDARGIVPVVEDATGIVAVLPSAMAGAESEKAVRRAGARGTVRSKDMIGGNRFLAFSIEGVRLFHGTRRQQ